MELAVERGNNLRILLAEQSSSTLAPFAELFENQGISMVHASNPSEVRSLSDVTDFCACIIVDDMDELSGLEMVRELHQKESDIPLVLIADVSKRKIPLEEVSTGWSGCYILKDRDQNYIRSAYSWVVNSLNDRPHGKIGSGTDSSENRELLHSQRLESVGMLASGIAHDFNNILMAILGNASIAKDKVGKDHEAYRFVNIIEQCAERASALSNSLMRYARGEKSDWLPIYLPDHVDDLLNIISTGLPGHVMVEKHFEQVKPVLGDATKLQQVIMNLCLNAGDAINERKLHSRGADYAGVLSISISPADPSELQSDVYGINSDALSRGFVRLNISDNGTGMSDETRQSIFTPFFTTKKSGRGLGLSSVREIIEEQGGFIEVASRPGEGTTFNVYLPCCDIELEEDGNLLEVFAEKAVLVIETDEEIRRLIGLNLQHMDYQVLLVESLDEALAVFLEHQERISLILTCIPPSIQAALRDLESLRRVNEITPIIVMSESPREEIQPLFHEELATEYIQEPLQPDVLIRLIRETIRKSGMD